MVRYSNRKLEIEDERKPEQMKEQGVEIPGPIGLGVDGQSRRLVPLVPSRD